MASRASSAVRPGPGLEEVYSLPTDELLLQLRTSHSGLTSREAEVRLAAFGPNEIAKRKKRTAITAFLLHFRSPLVIILLIAGLTAGFLGDVTDTAIIFSIVLMSVLLDFYQESKAENAAETLGEKVPTTATVVRDGVKREAKLSEIVPGDVVFLSAGDIVPADARVVTAKDLFVDQSTLTGESFPVEKTIATSPARATTITECTNCLFFGTSVVSGTSSAVVIRTGSSTEYGKIARTLVARQPETEFERGLRRFGYLIMEVTLSLVLFVFFIIVLYKHHVLESLLFSVALAVGLTPELLPMILSVNLSKGALAMSEKGVIVKRLASIQNFGSMDVLCTDKTGTLTENKITLVLHVDLDGKDSEEVLLDSFLNSYYETGLKSPLDEAILRHENVDAKGYEKIDEVPFDFVRKRVSIVVEREGKRLLITKGAPEEIFKVSSHCKLADKPLELSTELRKKMEQSFYELSSKGYRVLGLSFKEVKERKTVYSADDEADMVFLGFVAFIDPPKESVKESLQLLKNANIELKILTGDSDVVTRTVCERLGFEIKDVVLGSEIAELHDDALARVVEKANIFARVAPGQKDRVMSALRSNGHVVGFLGDGINDAPSMKTSDVGISVDNAVDVAKESADTILLRKDLTVLGQGVLEGRKTFGNTMKYVMMGTSSNFGNMFSLAAASLFLPFLPMLPTQILLNNLLYDVSELPIPTDNVDAEYVEKPRRWDTSFVRRFMLIFGPISSVFDFLTFFIMLSVFHAAESMFQTAWFLESLATQTLVIFLIRTRRTPFYRSRPSTFLLLSSLGVVGVALVVPFTPLGRLFGFVRLPLTFYVVLAGLVVLYLGLVEVIKRRFYRQRASALEQGLTPKGQIR